MGTTEPSGRFKDEGAAVRFTDCPRDTPTPRRRRVTASSAVFIVALR
jgi:hypothetical protein